MENENQVLVLITMVSDRLNDARAALSMGRLVNADRAAGMAQDSLRELARLMFPNDDL